MKPNEIDKFRGEYDFLSNFYKAETTIDGETYTTSEHAYQAAKTLDLAARRYIRECKTPKEAKKAGQKVKLRDDWEKIKLRIMEDIVRDKFTRHPDLKQKLLDTGDARLIEGNTWGDKIFGAVKSKDGYIGHNHLGRILMNIRSELRNGNIPNNELNNRETICRTNNSTSK